MLSRNPTLQAIILGEQVARGEAKIFCSICGMPTDTALLREVTVPNFNSEYDWKTKRMLDTRFALICADCASKHIIIEAIRGEIFPPPIHSDDRRSRT